MSDLIDRLRDSMEGSTMWQAADAIADLVAENGRLKTALAPVAALLQEAVAEYENRLFDDEQPPADDEKADAIYSWALGLTWGDVRKIIK